MKILCRLLTVASMSISAPAAAQTSVGDWSGTLDTGAGGLRIVVHIAQGPQGELTGTLDSPDQGALGIPLAEIASTDDGNLTFTVPMVRGRYDATWENTAKEWRGNWQQGAGPMPLVLSAAPPPPPLPANWVVPADAEIAALIDERIARRPGQGMVVGVLGPGARRIVARGPASGATFGGGTVFELGSISKVFTALLLADMANKGEVSLDDPAEKYLPAGSRMPERGGRKITLRDLSMHVSALPRLPDNMPFADAEDPYADYTEAHMLAFLARYELPRDIGSKWEYSNFGVGLLGYLLGRAAGSNYASLLRDRITGPLGMDSTAVELSPALSARFGAPYDNFMRPTKPWRLPALVGAGGIRSTAEDMLKFAAAALDPKSPIGAAMATTLTHRTTGPTAKVEQALGWQVSHPEPGREVVVHGGGTGGFRSQLSLEPSSGRAVVALTNSAAEPSTTDIASHLVIGTRMTPTPPVPPAPAPTPTRAEVTLPVAQLDRVLGRYEFAPGVIFNVTREGSQLRAQREGSLVGPTLPIYAEAPLRFFWKAVNGVVVFTTDAEGKVTGAEATFDGQKLTGKRLDP